MAKSSIVPVVSALPLPAAPPHPADAPVRQTLWQHPFVQEFLPYITSAGFHIGLILLAMMTVSIIMGPPKPASDQVIVPTAGPFVPGPPDLPKGPGYGPGGRSDLPSLESAGFSEVARGNSVRVRGAVFGSNDAESLERTVIGIAPKGSPAGRKLGLPDGDPNDTGIFGLPNGSPTARSIFRGRGGGGGDGLPPTVVFVCDASGSMVNKFDDLRGELRKAIVGLKPSQSFNIIFFQGDKALALDERQLLVNKPENRAKAFAFLDSVAACKTTDPTVALDMALRQRPGLIWLLTDGDFPDNEAVHRFLAQRNTPRIAAINTIAYVDRGESYEQVLRRIAQDNSGVFRFVAQSDLER
jgi:hypothetical protein